MKLHDKTIQCNAMSTQVNQQQMSTKNKYQQKTNVNQKQISTKNKCQPKTLNLTQLNPNVNPTQPNPTQFNSTQKLSH